MGLPWADYLLVILCWMPVLITPTLDLNRQGGTCLFNFSGYIEFGGVVVKFYSSVEITLYLQADFLLQYVTLFQSRDIVKNLVSL